MLKHLWILAAAICFSGCALFGGDEEPVHKNTSVRFTAPPPPFDRINVTSADKVWQSTRTGNTIAINSVCKASEDRSVKAMEESILGGVENLKTRNTEKFQIDGVNADRIKAEGNTEGVPISVDLVVYRKGECTYDLAYVGRKKTFQEEQKHFDHFLTEFHAP